MPVNRTIANMYKPLRDNERVTRRTTRKSIMTAIEAKCDGIDVFLIEKSESHPDMIQRWDIVYTNMNGPCQDICVHSERLSDMSAEEWANNFAEKLEESEQTNG